MRFKWEEFFRDYANQFAKLFINFSYLQLPSSGSSVLVGDQPYTQIIPLLVPEGHVGLPSYGTREQFMALFSCYILSHFKLEVDEIRYVWGQLAANYNWLEKKLNDFKPHLPREFEKIVGRDWRNYGYYDEQQFTFVNILVGLYYKELSAAYYRDPSRDRSKARVDRYVLECMVQGAAGQHLLPNDEKLISDLKAFAFGSGQVNPYEVFQRSKGPEEMQTQFIRAVRKAFDLLTSYFPGLEFERIKDDGRSFTSYGDNFPFAYFKITTPIELGPKADVPVDMFWFEGQSSSKLSLIPQRTTDSLNKQLFHEKNPKAIEILGGVLQECCLLGNAKFLNVILDRVGEKAGFLFELNSLLFSAILAKQADVVKVLSERFPDFVNDTVAVDRHLPSGQVGIYHLTPAALVVYMMNNRRINRTDAIELLQCLVQYGANLDVQIRSEYRNTTQSERIPLEKFDEQGILASVRKPQSVAAPTLFQPMAASSTDPIVAARLTLVEARLAALEELVRTLQLENAELKNQLTEFVALKTEMQAWADFT